ncbi:MAG: hypothetical protein ABIV21_03435 [Pyrinomonadaceae bacterium]
MGQNDQKKGQGTSGEPQNTAPKRDEFQRAGEAESSNQQNQGSDTGDGRSSGQSQDGQRSFDDDGLEEAQRAASVGADSSWRPTADPAAGDMATGSDADDDSQQDQGDTGR